MPVRKITYKRNKNGNLFGTFVSKSRGRVTFGGSNKRAIRRAVTKYDF